MIDNTDFANIDPAFPIDADGGLERLENVAHAKAPESLPIQPETVDWTTQTTFIPCI